MRSTIVILTAMRVAHPPARPPKRRRHGVVWVIGSAAAAFGLLPVAEALGPPAPPTNEQAAARLLNIAGEDFRIHETDHFRIAYDTSYEDLRPLIARLEGTFDAIWRFCEACELNVDPPDSRFEVMLFNGYEDFTKYATEAGVSAKTVAGFYHPGTNLAAFCNMSETPGLQQISRQIEKTQEKLRGLRGARSNTRSARQRRRDIQRTITTLQSQRAVLAKRFNRFVIQHEAAHQMFFNLGVHVRGAANPQWLVEGLACQFEVPQADTRGTLRRTNQMRLQDLRTALRIPPGDQKTMEAALRDALDAGRFVPLRDLITDSELFARGDGHLAFRYAQAWALVFFLQKEHRSAFASYLSRLAERQPGAPVDSPREIELFEAAFGTVDEPFERQWISQILRLRFDPRDAGE